MCSPYRGLSVGCWKEKTQELIKMHPLSDKDIVDVVLSSWKSIFDSQFGTAGFKIGVDIFPKPQILGFLLHELIPLELGSRFPTQWRGDEVSSEKDLVYIPNKKYSIELKTSSNPRHIYGNRSYAQKSTRGKKAKSGYYLAVNFRKVSKGSTGKAFPKIRLIRFGWLDSTDWTGQAAQTGQQASLSKEIETTKLLPLYSS
ncbi:MAG TPA: ScaI family restriction endonuclease [Saccharofermentans sp.]|nr:ScaI family restriction endonuclease [Saccharofermentans sp.]